MKEILKYLWSCCIVFVLVSCGEEKESGKPAADNTDDSVLTTVSNAQFRQGEMKIGKMSAREFPVIIEATGMIDAPPDYKAVISSFTNGYVKRTPLLVGDQVKQGQFLLSLENPEFLELQQQYLDAREQLTYLRAEYERERALREEEITSERNFLKAESDYNRNLSRFNALREKLKMLNIDPSAVEKGEISAVISIYSPITGSITAMNVNKGKYISTADELMKIVNSDHIHIELNVFEKHVLQLKKVQDMWINLPEVGSDSIRAEVYLVGGAVDGKSRTVKVHGHFKQDDTRHYATGMFVNASIITDSTKSMALPTESILTLDNENYVLFLAEQKGDDYLFKKREVKLGNTYRGYTAILNHQDFSEADEFLLQGAFSLLGE